MKAKKAAHSSTTELCPANQSIPASTTGVKINSNAMETLDWSHCIPHLNYARMYSKIHLQQDEELSSSVRMKLLIYSNGKGWS